MKIINRFGKSFVRTSDFATLWTDCGDTDNIVLPTGGLNGFDWTEVQNSTSVLRLNFSAKNPAHRQYANRCLQA
jgi:hypothetical protein